MSQDGLCRLWIHCLLEANWKDALWLIPGTADTVTIKRGAFITGRTALHKQLYGTVDHREIEKPSESTLWRRLQTLEKLGCVKLENVNNRCTMVSVCNYETYQTGDEPIRTADEQPVNSRRTADEQPVNTLEEGKKERRKEGKKEEQVPAEPVKPKPKATGTQVTADSIEYPEGMDTPDVRDAVARWFEHKRSLGQKYKSVASAQAIFRNVEWKSGGPAAFVTAVDHSIGNNYQGVFAPKVGKHGNSTGNNRPSTRDFIQANSVPSDDAAIFAEVDRKVAERVAAESTQ